MSCGPSRIVAGLILMALLSSLVLGVGPVSSDGVRVHSIDVHSGWTNVSSSPSPPPMAGAMMAYSSKAHRFVLFGGWDGGIALNGTWVYDPGNRTWLALHPTVTPPGRGDGMFVYDELADSFILFGGWHEEANQTYIRLADTWLFSPGSATWTERHPTVSPSARSDSQVAYNPLADAVLLVGGFDGSAYLADVWSYELDNDTWSPRPAASQPSPRADGRMVYLDHQDRFILFGGNDYSDSNFSFHHLSDTWAYNWNSNIWTSVPQSAGPSARDYPIFSFDPIANLALLGGGFGNRTILNDLWAFDVLTNAWINLTPAVSPPPRFAATAGFDLANNVLVLFSGLTATGLLADTWHFAFGPSSDPPSLSLTVLVGIGSIIAGVAAATFFAGLKRRRSHRPP